MVGATSQHIGPLSGTEGKQQPLRFEEADLNGKGVWAEGLGVEKLDEKLKRVIGE
jgi:hypothetical protein